MAIDRNKFGINQFSNSEVFEIQSSALLVDVVENPAFVAPVLAYGEGFTSATTGTTLATAIAPQSTNIRDGSLGPTVVTGVNTDDVVSVLAVDLANNFISASEFSHSDDVTRYFLGTPASNESITESNVCVLNGALTNTPPVRTRNVVQVHAAYTDVESSVDVSTIDAARFTETKVTWTKVHRTNHTKSSGIKLTPNQRKAITAALMAIPIENSCATGSYQAIFTSDKFYYTTPLRLRAPITVTGLTYTDQNGASDVIIDDQLPTTYVTVSHVYTPGAPEFSNLDSKLTAAGKAAIAGKQLDVNIRFVELGVPGTVQPPTTDSKNIIGAINELDSVANLAADNSSIMENSVWTLGVGDWRNSQVQLIDDPNSPGSQTILNPDFDVDSFNLLIQRNPDWDTQLAWRKLNLIPVLLKDRLLTRKMYPHPTIPGEEIGRLELDPDSQTTLLEATYSLWRHITADTMQTYGVSALTDTDVYNDIDTLNEHLSSSSFIDIFNMLHTTVSGISADITNINSSISGVDDMLVEPLSSFSIYDNLNTLYAGISAISDLEMTIDSLSGQVDLNSTNINLIHDNTVLLNTNIQSLSAYVLNLPTTGGTTSIPCTGVCDDVRNILQTIIDPVNPGGFQVNHPSAGPAGTGWPYTPVIKIPTDNPPVGVQPGSVVYRTIIGGDEYYMWEKPDGTWICAGPSNTTPPDYQSTGTTLVGPGGTPEGMTTPDGTSITIINKPLPSLSDQLNNIVTLQTQVEELSAALYCDGVSVCDTISSVSTSLSSKIDQLELYVDTTNINVINNTTNITELSGTTTALSANLEDLTNITNVTTSLTADVTQLEQCCATNTTNISSLSSTVYGPGDTYTTSVLQGNSLIYNMEMLYSIIGFTPTGDSPQVIINKNNITDINTSIINLQAFDINISTVVLALSGRLDNLDCNGVDICATLSSLSGDIINNSTNITSISGDVINNSTNITSISGDVINNSTDITSISGDVIDINQNITNITQNIDFTDVNTRIDSVSACCDDNNTLINSISSDLIFTDVNVTNIENTLTNQLTAIEHNITLVQGDYVDKTNNQTISGEKIFEDDLLVAAPAAFGEDVVIGTGDPIFNVCTAVNGATLVTVTGLLDDNINNISSLPVNSLYITTISGVKVISIKTP